MSTNTIRLHRIFHAPPERVYKAFLDAEAMVKWLPPNGFTGKVHHLDAKVGGTYKMSFTNFSNGQSHSFGGKYLELMPGERIRHTDAFDDPNLPGEMMTTITLKKVLVGTEVHIVNQPYKVGWGEEGLFLEAHPPLQELSANEEWTAATELTRAYVAATEERRSEVDWGAAEVVAAAARGIPEFVSIAPVEITADNDIFAE